MLICPNDATELSTIHVETVPVEQCPKCHGFWLDRGELETLGAHHHAHLEPLEVGTIDVEDTAHQCPRDGKPMREHEFAAHSGITIDICPVCQGVWLNADQLGKIIEYLDVTLIGTHPTLTQRIMLFLYQLVKTPPVY